MTLTRPLFLIAASFMPLLGSSAAAAQAGLCPRGKIQQLRIYEIFDHNKAAFHERFRDHAVRIMLRHGFDIVAQWETRHGDRTEFAYVLDWPDEATMKRRWDSFMADAEWAAIKQRTAAAYGDLVGEIEDRVMRATPYSPCLSKSPK